MTIYSTIPKMFYKKTQRHPRKKAIGWIEDGSLYFFTNQEYYLQVKNYFNGLSKLNLNLQDAVAILSNTCKEWHFFDLAIQALRGIVVPVYPTLLAKEVVYILNHCEAKCLILENDLQLQKIISTQEHLTSLKYMVAINKVSDDLIKNIGPNIIFYTYQQFLDLVTAEEFKDSHLFEESIEKGNEEDIASIIYTSGTTGEPKGAVVKQKAISAMLINAYQTLKTSIYSTDRFLVFLPLSHVLGRCDSLINLIFDSETVYAESLEKVVDNLQVAKPTVLISVPRIFEKIYHNVKKKIQEGSLVKKNVFKWALSASEAYYQKIENDQAPSPYEIIQKNLAYKLVFEKMYNLFGGRVRFLVSGGAPLSTKIMAFLQNANLTILEGYGLTETIAPCTLNPIYRQVPGTIGLPISNVKISFAEDGEILIKSDALFSSYFKNEKATAEAFNQDGWFLTGDVGELNKDGYIKITDRKKDIIITSSGKNIAPVKIENMLKLQRHISNAMVVGDKRKFLIAIISVDVASFSDILTTSERALPQEELIKLPQVYELIKKDVAKTNKNLASFESVKGFFLTKSDFTVENGLLTPSLKLKKKAILYLYEKEIEDLFNHLE